MTDSKKNPRRNIKEQVYFTPLVYALLVLMVKSNPRYMSSKGLKVTLLVSDIVAEAVKAKKYSQEEALALIKRAAEQEQEYINLLVSPDEYNVRQSRLTPFLEADENAEAS